MEAVFFSIIIPIYNVESYLADCMESVLFQSYQNYEIICVNDVSTDKSYEILCDFAKNHEKIKIINNKVNSGLSYSRNRGLERAKGDYVLFVDSDDYIENDTLKILAEILQNNKLDFLNFNYNLKIERRYDKEKNLKGGQIRKRSTYFKSGKEWFFDALNTKSMTIASWSRVYRKEFLLDNHLWFYEKLLHEDMLFLLQVVIKAKAVMSINDFLYFYRKRENSITATKSEALLDSMVVILNETISLIKIHTLDVELVTAIYEYIRRYCMPWIRMLMMYFPEHEKMMIGGLDAQFLFLVIKTLIGQQSYQYIHFNQEELKRIQRFDKRIIYGAGAVCTELLRFFFEKGIHIHAIAVSNRKVNVEQIGGYLIQQIDELIEYKEEALVIVAVLKRDQESIKKKLITLKFRNILLINTDGEERFEFPTKR